MDAFKQGNVKLGANLSPAAGPANASAEAQTMFNTIDIFSYAASEGVFAGASLQGSVLAPNSDMNNNFYDQSVTPDQILSGKVPAPAAASNFEQVLTSVTPKGGNQKQASSR